jgi:glutamate carboxypeptidase
MLQLLRFCEGYRDWAVELTRSLASLESPSTNKGAVDACGAAVAEQLIALGGRVERLHREQAGDHYIARFGAGGGQLLILGHFDTVWEVGQLQHMPLFVRDGKLFGPGVYDMKAGLVIAILALKALFSTAAGSQARVAFLCTSDEEIGSASSRGVIEALALESDAVLVLEPALAGGAVKTSRKGVGVFELEITGVPAHAGAQPGRGASAIVELAHQTLALQRLQDESRGISVNVGVVAGGSRSNVVPERAWAEIDVRVERLADAALIERRVHGLAPRDPRIRIAVRGGMNRPPMERTPGVARLYGVARSVASELGFDLAEGATGGASDGNFTAALGVPTLDGLGAVGDGAHATDEHVEIASLPRRAALLAGLMAQLTTAPPAERTRVSSP